MVRAVIYLGRNFSLDVIAEGVESEEQLAFLAENGCPEAQGYLFGRPVMTKTFDLGI
ncbi:MULTISPECIES: EAL domain-containing protein [Brevundimonas]|uniref:EAL domain-containing protein n=1 Tax=Brevundimonas vesicularis TaxID=41276 RepID=A0ABU4KQF9_BREVE|nr:MULTISPECIES: EAL domain-containing protein [Brevundimonas]MDX2335256.1 EAL domain-containing protein [Brevundimonas vesicularis]